MDMHEQPAEEPAPLLFDIYETNRITSTQTSHVDMAHVEAQATSTNNCATSNQTSHVEMTHVETQTPAPIVVLLPPKHHVLK